MPLAGHHNSTEMRIFEPGRQEGPPGAKRRLNDCKTERRQRHSRPAGRGPEVRAFFSNYAEGRAAHLLSAVPQEACACARLGEDCHCDVRCRECDKRCLWRPIWVDILRSRPLPVGRALWSFVARNPDLGTTVPVACAHTLRPRDLPTRLRRQAGSDIAAVGKSDDAPPSRCDDDIDIAVLFRGTAIHGARSGHASGRVGMRALSSSARSAFGLGLSPLSVLAHCARGASARV